MKQYIKDPDAVLDYQFDWSDWLSSDSDTISSYTVTVSGVTKDSDANTATSVTVWISGGTAGSVASVTCQVVTANGRTEDRTIKLIIQDR